MAGIKWEKETVNGLSSAGKNKKHDLYFQSLDDRERLYKENFEVPKGIVQDGSMTFEVKEKVYVSVNHPG